jgi:DNA-directed RNA polymerase subunit RPC12/RpoP
MEHAKSVRPEENTPVVAAELFCPRCGSERLHRSHRDGALERYVLRLVGVRPYRCESCNERFLSRKKPAQEPA